MQVSSSYPHTEDKLERVTSATVLLSRDFCAPHNPFVEKSITSLLLQKIVSFFVQIVERMLGQKIYVINHLHELYSINASIRKFLALLIERKHILQWETGLIQIGTEKFYKTVLMADQILDSDENVISHRGFLDGSSVDRDFQQSFVVALAEYIERYNSICWHNADFLMASFSKMQASSKRLSIKNYFKEDVSFDTEAPMAWVKMRIIGSTEFVYAPATSVFFMYPLLHAQEPVFMEASSSGVAAQTTKRKAIMGSVYELIERDSFMIYWLNKISPRQIDLGSIKCNDLRVIIDDLSRRAMSAHLLDCETEVGIPALVLVVVDDATGAVNVNAAANLNPDVALHKVFTDHIKWDPYRNYSETASSHEEIIGIEQRADLWRSGVMRDEINFLITGAKNSYRDYKQKYAYPDTEKAEYTQLVQQVTQQYGEIFLYEFPNEFSFNPHLHVVRTHVESLVPIYFRESKPHTNVERIYTFPKVMGYRDDVTQTTEINTAPHPFL